MQIIKEKNTEPYICIKQGKTIAISLFLKDSVDVWIVWGGIDWKKHT